MTTLVPRNTTIPVNKKEIFSTAENNQPTVTVHVLQGERSVASGNRSLAKFNLEGLPPAPRGIPQVEVVFDIDRTDSCALYVNDIFNNITSNNNFFINSLSKGKLW